ncbi:hypothetical protein H4Q26_014739 [Puccinia striiformis f. sp. tritici PST-130]|nr:hypothetical protein H4Q26_014739 [Puccinia striiformis f. sp. tritici PST-130]
MPPRTTQNPSALIRDVPVLDGTSVSFPAWRTRLEDLFAIQGVHDIVTGKLARPEANHKDAKPITQGSQQMTIHVDLAIRYKDLKPVSLFFKTICDTYEKNTRARRMMLQDSFWCARHDPSQQWIAKVRNTASDLKSVKLTPADQQYVIVSFVVWTTLETDPRSSNLSRPYRRLLCECGKCKTKKKLGCWRCGQTGHHSATCSNPPLRQSKAAANAVEARAGATSVAPLGNGGPSDEEDDSLTKKSKYIGMKTEVEEPFILRKRNSGTT